MKTLRVPVSRRTSLAVRTTSSSPGWWLVTGSKPSKQVLRYLYYNLGQLLAKDVLHNCHVISLIGVNNQIHASLELSSIFLWNSFNILNATMTSPYSLTAGVCLDRPARVWHSHTSLFLNIRLANNLSTNVERKSSFSPDCSTLQNNQNNRITAHRKRNVSLYQTE